MEKPTIKHSRPYYDIFEILDYVDNKIPGFKDIMVENLVEVGYINNHTLRNIYWERFLENDMPEVVIKGVEYMLEEFPSIKNNEVDFWICW